jgi:hypothetical protein
MADSDQDSWVKSVLGLDVVSYAAPGDPAGDTGAAPGDEAAGATGAAPAKAKLDDGAAPAEVLTSASKDGAQGDAAGEGDGNPALKIEAKSNGDGTFTITGSGFTAKNAAYLRVTDRKFYQVWGSTVARDGKFSYKTGNVCMNPGGPRWFSANDASVNLKDLTGTHWSNYVEIDCDPSWAVDEKDRNKDKDKDLGDPDGGNDDPGPEDPPDGGGDAGGDQGGDGSQS